MYSDETKYNDENDSWNFKLIIFHDMCARAEVSETIKLMTFLIMFKGFALDYYYSNVSTQRLALNFVQTCVLINVYFEDAEYKRNVMIKWNVIFLRSVMIIFEHQDKSMHECLQLLIKKFCHLQHDLNKEFWTDKFIHNKLITACQKMLTCQYVYFKFFDTLTDLINDLQSFIIIFSKSHSHQIENYQSDVAYYIDRRYRNNYFRRRLSNDSNQLRISYDWKKNNLNQNQAIISYNSEKRCFICKKIDCWFSNHFWKKRDVYKKQLKNVSTNRFSDLIISQRSIETNKCFSIWLIIFAVMRALILISRISLTN